MKIKVKRVRGGSMGDQRDYGLVTGSIWNRSKPSTNQVSETMSPVDRDEATIEAERGETIVGDLNNDGMLEHAIVGGKRHFEGGTPLNVPDGSFVFSDTRSLLIKNKDVLKNIFGISASKGMTPAKVAKKYDLNQYNSILMDPDTDPMSKKTAQMMLDNNLKKLGQLALVQEGMKGFPDGIPDIATPLFGSDIAVSQASQEGMARRGGLLRAQGGVLPKHQIRGTTGFEGVLSSMPGFLSNAWESAKEVGTNIASGISALGSMANSARMEYDKRLDQRRRQAVQESIVRRDLEKAAEAERAKNNLKFKEETLKESRGVQQRREDKISQLYQQSKREKELEKAVEEQEKLKDPIELQYRADLKKFNDWKKQWDAAVKKNDKTAIENLKKTGKNLAGILGSMDYTDWDPGFNWSLFSSPYKIASGTRQGQVNDASDVITNLIDKQNWAENTQKNKQLIQERNKKALDEASKLEKDALAIARAYNEKGIEGSGYTAEQIQNAFSTLESLEKRPKVRFNPNASSDEARPLIYMDWNFDPRISMESLTDIRTKYPLNIATEEPVQEEITATQESLDEPDNFGIAPTDTTGTAPADTSGTNIQVNTTGSGSGVITRVPKTMSDQDAINQLLKSGAYEEGETPTPGEIESYKRSKGIKLRLGGDLPKHQGRRSVVSYNLRDKKYRDAAAQKGYVPVQDAWSWYDPNLPTIGPQRVLLPSGIYTTATGPRPVIEELEKFPGIKDWTEYAPGGFNQWMADMAAAKGAPSTASEFWGKKRKAYDIEKTGISSIDESQPDWNVPGVEFMTPYVWGTTMREPTGSGQDMPPPEPSPATPPVSGRAAFASPNYVTPNYRQPWSNYSMVDYLAAMGNYMDVRRGRLPNLYQYTPIAPDATFLDPARAIAQQQGLVAQSTEDIASRSMDPTTGRANIIAAQAQSADPIANIQAKYDEANAQIANQRDQQYANTMNDAQLKNIGFREQYSQALETLEQQYQNALREGRTEVAESIKRAMVDAMHRGALNVQNPNYAIGPNGVIYFKPGYNPSTGENSLAASTSNPRIEMYKKLRADGYNEKDAKNMLDLMYGKSAQEGGTTAYVPFAAYNPIDLIWG